MENVMKGIISSIKIAGVATAGIVILGLCARIIVGTVKNTAKAFKKKKED